MSESNEEMMHAEFEVVEPEVAARYISWGVGAVEGIRGIDLRVLRLAILGSLLHLGFNVVATPAVIAGLPDLGPLEGRESDE